MSKTKKMRVSAVPQTTSANSRVVRILEERFQEGKAAENALNFPLAESIYREVIAGFERNRFNAAMPLTALGYVLLHQNKLAEAERVLRRSIRLKYDIFESHVNLAAVYRLTGRWIYCIAASKRALKMNPTYVPTLLNLAEGLQNCQQHTLSVQHFLLALSLDNDNIEARQGLATNYVSLGEPAVSIPMFHKIIEMDPKKWPLLSYLLFGMQYEVSLSNEEVLQEHLNYGRKVRELAGPPQEHFDNSWHDPQRRMRIGYITSDFRHHVVMKFMEHVLSAHDRSQVELVLIYTSTLRDKYTEKLQNMADEWVDIANWGDDIATARIRDLKLDILIDLAGHSGTVKLAILARRLAPLQVNWLGYSGTSGVDTMDYIIVDNVIAPPGERHYFTETPLRLPAAYLCFGDQSTRPVSPLPYERNGYITFGCMNNPSKINAHVVSWWVQILRAVPTSKLLMRYGLLVEPLVRERIVKMLHGHGISEDRYEMKPGTDDFMAVYDDVDIALDTFPYNGTTTTCESLWMGVPVIALRGDTFASRVGASILTYTGLRDLITETPEGYIKLAVDLAGKPEHLAELRRQLRPHLITTPVYDGKTFTEGLEYSYRQIFKTWCSEQASRHLLAS